MDIGHMAPLFIVGIGLALIGWVLVHISADRAPASGTQRQQVRAAKPMSQALHVALITAEMAAAMLIVLGLIWLASRWPR
jgi:hypothetical protein